MFIWKELFNQIIIKSNPKNKTGVKILPTIIIDNDIKVCDIQKLYNDGSKSSHIQNVADYAQILVESNVEVPSGAEKLGVISKFVKYLLKSGKNIDLTRMNEIISKVKEIIFSNGFLTALLLNSKIAVKTKKEDTKTISKS